MHIDGVDYVGAELAAAARISSFLVFFLSFFLAPVPVIVPSTHRSGAEGCVLRTILFATFIANIAILCMQYSRAWTYSTLLQETAGGELCVRACVCVCVCAFFGSVQCEAATSCPWLSSSGYPTGTIALDVASDWIEDVKKKKIHE